jgi:predicted dienelactone hydrolase
MSEDGLTAKPPRREGRGEQHLLANLCGLRASAVNLVFLGLLLAGALLWARGRDPFERRWFKVHPAGAAAAECVAILPKMAAWPLPVVVWLHGSGGSVTGSGDEMRQMAEMGLAVVGLEYEEKAESRKQKAESRKQKAEIGRAKAESGK